MNNPALITKKVDEILSKYSDLIKTTDRDQLYAYIERCIEEDTVLPPSKYMHKSAHFYKRLGIFLYKFITIFMLCLGIVCFAHGSTMSYLEKNSKTQWMQDLTNKFLFESRRLGLKLGLQKFDAVKKLYDADCLIDNPFAPPPEINCFCQYEIMKHNIKDMKKAQKNFVEKYKRNKINPFVVLNAFNNSVSFENLRQIYLKHRNEIELQGHTFVENLDGGAKFTPDEIFKNVFPPKDHSLEWYFNHVDAVRNIRPLFPRLPFVPKSNEINLARQLFFFGENAPNKTLAVTGRTNSARGSFYIQAWGERNVTLSAPQSCNCNVEPISFILKEKHTLMVPLDSFEMTISPTEKKGYSIGYMGSVMVN